jgi:hypothetical protein
LSQHSVRLCMLPVLAVNPCSILARRKFLYVFK